MSGHDDAALRSCSRVVLVRASGVGSKRARFWGEVLLEYWLKGLVVCIDSVGFPWKQFLECVEGFNNGQAPFFYLRIALLGSDWAFCSTQWVVEQTRQGRCYCVVWWFVRGQLLGHSLRRPLEGSVAQLRQSMPGMLQRWLGLLLNQRLPGALLTTVMACPLWWGCIEVGWRC